MITKKGWQQSLMMSLFRQESADGAAKYNEPVAITDSLGCSMKGFEVTPEYADEVANDREEVSGTEHGTHQEIVAPRVNMTYSEPKAKPNTLIGLAALTLGNITSTQDGAYDGYKHKIVPATVGTALPSITAEHLKGGVQTLYSGLKGNSLTISGEAGGMVAVEASLLGSGHRAASSTAFAAALVESWLKMCSLKAWLESGASISIGATLVQGAQDISSETGTPLDARLQSFSFTWNNNLEPQPGIGTCGVLADADYGRRSGELTLGLLFNSQADLDYYLNQTVVAVELDLKGGIIDADGSLYYGAQIIAPKLYLTAAPLPQGGAGDTLTCEFAMSLFDDGTNPAVIIEGYNAVEEYLALAPAE